MRTGLKATLAGAAVALVIVAVVWRGGNGPVRAFADAAAPAAAAVSVDAQVPSKPAPGVVIAQLGELRAPVALAADRGGAVIIDGTSLVRVGANGERRPSLPLPVHAPEEVAISSDGRIAVLDRRTDRVVAV